MTPRLKTPLLAAVLGGAIFAVIWALHQNLLAADAEAGVRTLRASRVQFENRLTQLEDKPAAALDPVPTMAELTGRRLAGATDPGAQTRRSGTEESTDPWTLVVNDPVLQNLYLAAERASLAGRYAAVLAELRLAPAEVEKLEELILRRNEHRMDLDGIGRASRLGDQDRAIARHWDRADQAFRSGLIALLGNPAAEGFEQYERTLAAWELVNRFAGAVALEGQPLTPPQAVQLSETVAEASLPYQEGGRVDTNAIDWPGVMTESAVILSEPQHVSFRNMAPLYPLPVSRRETPVPAATN